MISALLTFLAGIIIAMISTLGYGGIILVMAIESACIPLPSEVIMPFSGYLVSTGRFELWLVSLAGTVGCVLGSIVAYGVGYYGGRSMIEKYGRYILISKKDLEMADEWFRNWGGLMTFVSRLLPAIRTFISLPAGIARMPFGRFVLYTFLGSFPWCWGLAWVGQKMGEHWDFLGPYFHKFDLVIAAALVTGVIWWIRRHWRHLKEEGSV